MTLAVAVVAVLVLAWFAGGTVWNVRRGSALMRWMQGGLPLLGERTTARWLGSSAVEMAIRDAKAPFREVTVILFLEPRDLPWMWAVARARGRRDTIIVRGELRSAPKLDLEALDPASWSGRDALRRLEPGEWSVREPAGPAALPVYYKTPAALARADALLEIARRAGAVRRLSVRRGAPHLQLHAAAPDRAAAAREFFEAVRALGERA